MSEKAAIGPRGAPPQARASKEVWTVQAMRFLAAFGVVCLHSTFYAHERLVHDLPLYKQGMYGVRLFFVISGFVMILSSERLTGRAHGGLIFAVRRIFRIVPLYWLVMAGKLVTLLFVARYALHTRTDRLYIIKSFFFIPARNADGIISPFHGVGWTLNFEMLFYLLFTIALLLRKPPVRLIGSMLLLLLVASLFVTKNWPVPLQFYCNPIVIDFLVGMIIARWYQRGIAIRPVGAWGLMIGGLFGLFVPVDWPAMPALVQSLLVTLLSASAIIGAVALEDRLGARLPRWIVYMGAASYSLYLIHPLIAPAFPVLLARLHWPSTMLSLSGSILSALLGGAVLYRYVETPLNRMLSKWLRGSRLMGPKPHIGALRPEENVPGETAPYAMTPRTAALRATRD